MPKRVTIKDVAKKVGVTPTTISMALHKNKSIPPKTVERIMKAIKEMNYYPNYAARSLVGGKTGVIALMADFFSTPFIQTMIDGIEDKVVETSYSLVQYITKGLREMENEIFLRILHGRTADALIVFNMRPDAGLLAEFKKNKFPVVLIEGNLAGINLVTGDNEKGGYTATEYLINKGRRNIAIISGKQRYPDVQDDRLAGYKKALIKNGLIFDEKKIIQAERMNFSAGREIFNRAIKGKKDIDAVFCAAGDITAIGVMYEAGKQGVKVPQDLAVVGYDDLESAMYVSPPLTTIRQPGYEMGAKAFEIVLKELGRTKVKGTEKIILPPELVERESV